MANYYYYIDPAGRQQGPFELPQLGGLIAPDTMVWHEGLPEWRAARSLPELQYLFSRPAVPPPPVSYGRQEPMPKTWLVESILVLLFCCVVGGVVALIYSTRVEDNWLRGNYEEARRNSQTAGNWVKWSFIVTLVLSGIWLLLWILATTTAFTIPFIPMIPFLHA